MGNCRLVQLQKSLPQKYFEFIRFVHFAFKRPKYGITEQRTGYKGIMRLTIRSFSSADVGTYHCVSTNSLGRAEGTLRLYGMLINCIEMLPFAQFTCIVFILQK